MKATLLCYCFLLFFQSGKIAIRTDGFYQSQQIKTDEGLIYYYFIHFNNDGSVNRLYSEKSDPHYITTKFNEIRNRSVKYIITKDNQLELKTLRDSSYVYCGNISKNTLIIKKSSCITMDGKDTGELKFYFKKE